jgi:hypothetical protein
LLIIRFKDDRVAERSRATAQVARTARHGGGR